MAGVSTRGLQKALKFDRALTNSYIARYLKNPRLVVLLLLSVIILGINAFSSLPRDLNPQIKIPIVLVTAILPGANPQDVESQVTVHLEDTIRSLQGVKTVTSVSQDGFSQVTVEFNSGVDPDKAKSDVQSAVDSVTGLPQDVLTPQVLKLDFENSPIWTFVLTSGEDPASLYKFAKNLKKNIRDLPEIDKVEISGLEETEVQITVSPQTYAAYNISPFQISQLISNALKSFPAGSIITENNNFSLSLDPQAITVDDLRNIQISVGSQIVELGEIATITQHPKPAQNQSYLAFGQKQISPGVTFNVFRTRNTKINKAIEAAEIEVEKTIQNNQEGKFQTVTVLNTSEEIDKQFFDLTRDFLITVALVVSVIFIFLGPRQALISALSAPLSFLITFVVMQINGISLNFLSLFSLILSLGLLVDDTVVIISAMSSYYKTKSLTPFEAGILVWRDFLTPVFTTTITTVWAFLPLLLSSGIIGEFIKSIPIVVSTALIASFFVGMFITLPLMVILLKPRFPRRVSILFRILTGLIITVSLILALPKGNLFAAEISTLVILLFAAYILRNEIKKRLTLFLKNLFAVTKNIRRSQKRSRNLISAILSKNYSEGIISFDKIEKKYKISIEEILKDKAKRRMAILIVIIFSVFSFALLPLGFVKNEFFPKTDEDLFYISVEYPPGTYISQTKKEALALLQEIKETSGVKYASLNLGTAINLMSGGTQASGSNVALFSINLKQKNSSLVAQALREKYSNYQSGKLNIVEVSGGPPAGADVQIKISGDDLRILNQEADQIMFFLKGQPGVTNIDKSIKAGTSKLSFTPDKSLLAQNNIGLDQLGFWLRLYASGIKSETNKFPGEDEDQDITLRLYPHSSTVEGISQIIIPTQNGNIPLSSLGKISLAANPTLITREDGKRTIAVAAAIKRGFSVSGTNTNLEKYARDDLNLPEGYSWKTGGVNEENQNSVQSILRAMFLSFMLIIITMVIQFSSFRRALIVMLVIPLSISGVFIIFSLTKTPLSFPALIGVLALFGIVVKNSILLVDKIVANEKLKMPLILAISSASASRLEPIALTSFATILGLIPITLTDPLWRGLGGVIIAGLSFSGITMLVFIPVVYYIIYQNSRSN